MSENYIPNAGQTFLPALHSPYTQTVPYDKAADLPSKEGGYQFHEKMEKQRIFNGRNRRSQISEA